MQHLAIPAQAQPTQIRQDCGLGPGAVARGVEIINAQQPLPAPKPGVQPAEQGCAQIAAVQGAGGGRGETAPIAQLTPAHAGLQQELEMAGQRRGGQG